MATIRICSRILVQCRCGGRPWYIWRFSLVGAYGSGGSHGLQNRWGRRKATGRFDSYTLPPDL